MSKVVSLRGMDLPEPGKPVEPLVSQLERLLEQAKSGEIHGISYAISFADAATASGCAGAVQNTYALIGRLHEQIDSRLRALRDE